MFNWIRKAPILGYLFPKVSLSFAEGEGEGEGSAGKTDWKETIPQEIRNDPIFEKFENPGDAFKSLVEAQKFLGREKLPVPKDENDQAAYDMIFKKLGLPENEKGYQLPTDLQIPKDLPIDEKMIEGFKKIAYESKLLPSQVASLYKWYIGQSAEQFKQFGVQRETSAKDAEAALRKDWGAAYQQNVTLAGKVFNTFAGEKEWEAFEQKYGNDPVLIKMFAEMGKVLSEEQLVGKPKSLSYTPDEAQAEINKIMGDSKSPYFDGAHPQHQEFVEKVARLTKMTLVGQ